MEALVSRHEGTAIVKDVRKQIDKLLVQLYGEPGTGGAAGGGGGGSGGSAGRGGRNSQSRARMRGADRKSARQEVHMFFFISLLFFCSCLTWCLCFAWVVCSGQ